MPGRDLIELTAFWGNDDAESTIRVSLKIWEQINGGARFQKTAKSYYEGQSFDVTWVFFDRMVSIDAEDGMQCVAGLPVQDLIVRTI